MGGMVNAPDSALERLWRDSSARLRGFFARQAGESEADDLVQETFVRVHERLDTLEDAASLRAWVGRIARNVLADHGRRRAVATDEAVEGLAERVDEPDLERTVAGWLEGHLCELDHDDAALLRQVDLEGRSQQVLADALGLTLSGAKSRVQRARRRLRERLEACCSFDFDARGGILAWQKKRAERCDDC
jgi:RNA polymerase sigma-70 factor (ECF subfamily)